MATVIYQGDHVVKYSDGTIVVTTMACDGDMDQVRLDVVEAVFGWDNILAAAELAPDITEDEWDEFGQAAYSEAVDELFKKIAPNISLERLGRIISTDIEGCPDGDYFDEYEVTYKEVK